MLENVYGVDGSSSSRDHFLRMCDSSFQQGKFTPCSLEWFCPKLWSCPNVRFHLASSHN
jgi:hypothetical protein